MLLQEYQKSWADDFKTISQLLQKALANLQVSIEHVGSTSVPALAAKPIIDIDIVLPDNVAFDDVKKQLETIGYYHNGNQGIPDRDVFKRRSVTSKNNVLDSISHHLYVCPAHSDELRKHILLRDYLIANADARNQYQQLKYKIAAEANQDRKTYALLKETQARAFISDIIAKAENSTNTL